MEWISIKDKLPEKGDRIVYCSRTRYVSAIGRYWNDAYDVRGPIPSRPDWLTWDTVTHWFKLDEVDP